uniref:Uncharacterized protein n=1 Tax=Branchiostoma floridae TaxID=7739 RepID=C3Y7B0_BRAFL|eukprot:XP_002607728.1 hypothetical protein BRAFLDRAFT_82825 [Branchiostoma floridae]
MEAFSSKNGKELFDVTASTSQQKGKHRSDVTASTTQQMGKHRGDVTPTTTQQKGKHRGDVTASTSQQKGSDRGGFTPSTTQQKGKHRGDVTASTSQQKGGGRGDVTASTSQQKGGGRGDVTPSTSQQKGSDRGDVTPTTTQQKGKHRGDVTPTTTQQKGSDRDGVTPSTTQQKGSDRGDVTASTSQQSTNKRGDLTAQKTTAEEEAMAAIKRHYMGAFDIPIKRLVEPAWKRLVRAADPQHVSNLKQRFIASSGQMTTVLIGNIPEMTTEHYDRTRVDRYRYEVIGGNHTRIALQEILRDTPEKLDVASVHMHIYCGLPDDLAKRVGMAHNNVMNYSKPETTLDQLISMRASLYNKAGFTRAGDMSSVEPPAEKKTKDAWKEGLAVMLRCDGDEETKPRKQLNNRHRRSISLAEMPCAVWNGITEFAKKWEERRILGQKKTELKPTHLGFLDDDDETAKQVSTLQGLNNGELDYKEVMQTSEANKSEKKKNKQKMKAAALQKDGDGGAEELDPEGAKNDKNDGGDDESDLGGLEPEGAKKDNDDRGDEDADVDLQTENRNLLANEDGTLDKIRTSNKRKSSEQEPPSESQYKADDFVVVPGNVNDGDDIEAWFGRVVSVNLAQKKLRLVWSTQASGLDVQQARYNTRAHFVDFLRRRTAGKIAWQMDGSLLNNSLQFTYFCLQYRIHRSWPLATFHTPRCAVKYFPIC